MSTLFYSGPIPMKKKLLITVGAGASMDFGLPSVSDIDVFFDTSASNKPPTSKKPYLQPLPSLPGRDQCVLRLCTEAGVTQMGEFRGSTVPTQPVDSLPI